MITTPFWIILAAMIVALLIAPAIAYLARRTGLVDLPNSAPHKRHTKPTPIAGGLVILIVLVALGFWLRIWQTKVMWAMLAASLPIFIFGLWDDISRLPAVAKLADQLLGAGVLISLGLQVRLFEPEWLNWIVTILWVVGITNAFNFVDSMDGLAAGLGAQSGVFFMLVTLDSGQTNLAYLGAILTGACIGCYYYNSEPAHFFLGDSGSQLLGFLLAGLAIAYNPVNFYPTASWSIPVLLLGVPVFDLILVVYSRIRGRRPVYRASLDHTYHRLVSMGMSSRRAVLTMHVTALILGSLALIMLNSGPFLANSIAILTVVTSGAALLIMEQRWNPEQPPPQGW